MSGAILNLVRLNTADETAPDHDYTGGEIFERHEEISLVDPDGCPCAIPTPAAFTDIDYKYGFITGAIGHQTRAILRDLSINIDYVESDKATRMEHWMQQRAFVLFTPNMGRNTVFSFRPVDITLNQFTSGGTATDLTGNHNLVYVDASTMLHWDRVKRRFVKKSVSNSLPIHHTPGGCGMSAARAASNLMVPSYPKSATEGHGAGDAGWTKSGAEAAQLTLTHNPGGFGHTDCPDSLIVDYTNDEDVSRSLDVQDVFDPGSGEYGGVTPSGSGTMSVCVWLRGQLPDICILGLYGDPDFDTRRIDGKRLDGWTPIFLSVYSSNWAASVPLVRLYVHSSEGIAGSFEIGPTMICQSSGSTYQTAEYWAPSQSSAGHGKLATTMTFQFPAQGTINISFHAPDWFNGDYMATSSMALVGNDDWRISIYRDTSGDYSVFMKETGADNVAFLLDSSPIIPGEINTISYAWSGYDQRLFCNGKLVGTVDRSADKITFGGNDSELMIGHGNSGESAYPLILLSMRIDEGAMTNEEVANVHLSLTDPTALQFARMTRGRVYQITGTPQTVRSSAGGSQIMGTLKLKQVDFQSWLADPLNKEESVL